MKIKILSTILTISCLFTYAVPTFAESEQNNDNSVIAMESFDGQTTNTINIEGVTIKGGTGKIVQAGYENKALKVDAGESAIIIQKTFTGNLSEEFTVSYKLKSDIESSLNMSLDLMSGTSTNKFLKIESNSIKTLENKEIGSISPQKFTEISMVYKPKGKLIDVYIDKRAVLENWRISTWPSKFSGISFTKTLSGAVYIDDIVAVNGDTLKDKMIDDYTDDIVDDLHIDENVGDYTYFRTRSQANTSGTYFNVTLNPKTNEIINERADYKNPNKGDSIIFNKSTTDDVYMDISTRSKIKMFEDGRHYKYFYFESDFQVSNAKSLIQMFLLRDNTTNSVRADSVLCTISNRDLVMADGKIVSNIVEPEQWMNYKALVDLSSHTAMVYINNNLVAEVALNKLLQQLDVVRFSVDYGSAAGTTKIKNTEITGLVKRPEGLDITRTDAFVDETPIRDYLENKIAFHHYGNVIYKDSQKTAPETNTIYENGELYVSLNDFNTTFGTSYYYENEKLMSDGNEISAEKPIQLSDGVPMLPTREIAEKQLGKHTLDDTHGMVIFADEPMYWKPEDETEFYKEKYVEGTFTSLSPLQHMNSFLFFVRPSVDELKEKFDKATDNGRVHPRIYGTKQDFDNIKLTAETDSNLKGLIDKMIASADTYIDNTLTIYEFEDAYRQYNKANKFATMMEKFGFAYLMTGDKKYVDEAWKHVESVCGFPDFNENHAIDCGLYMTGLGIAYDWMYDGFTAEQKKIMEDSVLSLGIGVMDRAYYIGLPSSANASTMPTSTQITPFFTKWKSNYNTHVNAGVVIAALAFAEADPDLCFRTLSHALKSVEYTMYGFVPDGAWVESNDYWAVTVKCMVKIISALEGTFNTDYNFGNYQGFANTCRFHASFGSANGEMLYGDAGGESVVSHEVYSYFAKQYDQKDIAYLRKANLDRQYTKIGGTSIGIFDLLYYRNDFSEDDANSRPKMSVFKGFESVSLRESYTDPNAFFFVAHAGLSNYYHCHNDGGHFGFDMDGERWALDIGKNNYNAGIGDNAIYRKRTEGHNTLTINNNVNYNQKLDAFASLLKADGNDVGGYAVYDLTPYYADANNVTRGFYVDENFTAFTVRDELDLKKNSEVYWFMHTRADINIIDDKTAILSQHGKSLVLQFETDADSFELSGMEAVPLPSSPSGGNQDSNDGFHKVAIRMEGSGKFNLTVRMSPYSVNSINTTPIEQWTLPQGDANIPKEDFSCTLKVGNLTLQNTSIIPVFDEENIPDFQIIPNSPDKTVEINSDDKMLGGKVTATVYNKDRTKSQQKIYTYSSTSSELLVLYDQYKAESIQVTDEPEPDNLGVNAIDGDLITRWCAKQKGAEGIIDFGHKIDFDAFTAAFWKGSERKYSFEIQTSDDGINFKSAGSYTSTGTSENYEIYRLDSPAAGRYIKFVNMGNNATVNYDFSNLIEFMLLNTKS